ncbi:MAG: transposase [Phycisphaeraceae bacterium]|nr:transposase [Phycisphaeraceae bacterium]MBX3407631.1 transposase [Phycisphaeraceae bacterium]
MVQSVLGPVTGSLIVDDKPLPVSEFTGDPDAKNGWGAGWHCMGYNLHALIDQSQRLLSLEVAGMNEAECNCAREPLSRAAAAGLIPRDGILLGDASDGSNPLRHAAADAGVRPIAPKRRPGLGLFTSRRHYPARLAAMEFTEHDPAWNTLRKRVRATVGRCFGTLATLGGGLWSLPTWVRRLHRVRAWVAADSP